MKRYAALIVAIALTPSRHASAEAGQLPPWMSAHGEAQITAPTFLDTSDRRIKDDRPPPAAAQVAGLREMEAEIGRFLRVGSSYRDTIVAMLQREYDRQRRDREESYSAQIKAEEAIEDKARLSAIELFERFIAKYPNDSTYSADAMFRLGELYFERDSINQQNEMNAYLAERDRRLDAGESADGLIEPEKNFGATVGLYQRLVQTFPTYSKLDGVYYLIGYCHSETGESDIARTAWLNLVCANRFTYTGQAAAKEEEPPIDSRDQEHPALTLDAKKKKTAVAPTVFDDPYANCEPAAKDSKFWAETWLRIGEYHFDLDFTPHGLERAISAYSNVLARPNDRNYNLALYKVAWTYYRASRYPEALDHFWKLLQWSDDERKRTGKGSELRDEAVQYLAIGFGYDDWNENQVPDPIEGQQRGIDRVQDPKLMPQDRPWTSEVFFRLGYVYFDEAKYPDAIEVWQLALKRWPTDAQAPEVQNSIAIAHTRFNQQAEAIAARGKLSDYGQGSNWWEANKDHPVEQRRAEELAEDALINTAVVHHQRAQSLRRRCVEVQEPALCTQSQEEYGFAALAYRGYITHYPNNPQAYELNYNLADALYWSEDYEQAATEYALVRDSNLDDKYLSVSARLAVESIKRLVEKQSAGGGLVVRTEPPTPAGTPASVTPIELPEPLQRLARARELYLARVDDAHDVEKVRDSYFYNNSLLLYLYGYWDLARSRFFVEWTDHCSGPKAGETGQTAWINMRNMAVALGQSEEVRWLGAELKDRKCTFSPSGTAVAAVDCARPENKDAPLCVAGQDLTNLGYRDAVAIFDRGEKATGDEQRALYEQAASELIKAVNEEPNHPQAPLALEKAAIALERTSRFESAGRLYQRIIDEVGPRKGATPEEQAAFDSILANAYFRLAYNANRFFDFDRAVDNYRTLADSPRFAQSKDPKSAEWREGSLINAAKILEYQQQYARAGEYYARAAEILKDPGEQRAARFRVAEMPFKLQQWSKAITDMRAFIARYQGDKQAGEQVVEAYNRIAQARAAVGAGRDQEAALADVVSAYARSGQAPGSFAAEYAASAQFQAVDKIGRTFEKFEIEAGRPATLEAYVKSVAAQIESGGRDAKNKADAYNLVPPYRRPTWTIAAFVKQGRVYEILARGVLNTKFVVPADLQKKMKGLPQESQDTIKVQVEDTIRQLLDSRVRPIECLAVARYALGARAARAGNIDTEYTRDAFDRINAYGDERIAECITQVAATDKTFTPYQPGEFKRSPRGMDLDIPARVAPPPLAGGAR